MKPGDVCHAMSCTSMNEVKKMQSAFYYRFSSPFTGYLPLSRHFIFIITLFISIITFLTKVCHHHHLSTNINILKLCKANITCNVTCFPRTSRHKTFHFTVLFQTATLLVFRVRDVIFRVSFSRTLKKKIIFVTESTLLFEKVQ